MALVEQMSRIDDLLLRLPALAEACPAVDTLSGAAKFHQWFLGARDELRSQPHLLSAWSVLHLQALRILLRPRRPGDPRSLSSSRNAALQAALSLAREMLHAKADEIDARHAGTRRLAKRVILAGAQARLLTAPPATHRDSWLVATLSRLRLGRETHPALIQLAMAPRPGPLTAELDAVFRAEFGV
jgi:hypothetical protein